MKRLVFFLVLFFMMCTWAQTSANASTTIKAYIDGQSQIILQGNSAQWYHILHDAPGRNGGNTYPTTINGSDWYPIWSDIPDARNNSCNCYSNVYNSVSPPIPSSSTKFCLKVISARESVEIKEQPTSQNKYKLIIEFNDNSMSGADWYEIEVYPCQTASPAPVPTINQWGMIVLSICFVILTLVVLKRKRNMI
ncbi:hypothetical protein [Desulfatiglans anilini]|uniref:hypothetical protein n=1 Tax=Desulfatiglans anilini TaxID=90728 RepID=UPI000488B7FA|nr:hypothetical protein [Desulfatiglans anilini]